MRMRERLAERSTDFSKYSKKEIHTNGRATYLKVKSYFKMHNCQCCRTMTLKNQKIHQ